MFIWTPSSEETSHKNDYVKELGLKKIKLNGIHHIHLKLAVDIPIGGRKNPKSHNTRRRWSPSDILWKKFRWLNDVMDGGRYKTTSNLSSNTLDRAVKSIATFNYSGQFLVI